MEGKNNKEIPIDRHYFITWCKVMAIKFFYDQNCNILTNYLKKNNEPYQLFLIAAGYDQLRKPPK